MVPDNESNDSLKAGSSDKENMNEEVFSYINTGDFVKAVYEGEFYPDCIVEKNR